MENPRTSTVELSWKLDHMTPNMIYVLPLACSLTLRPACDGLTVNGFLFLITASILRERASTATCARRRQSYLPRPRTQPIDKRALTYPALQDPAAWKESESGQAGCKEWETVLGRQRKVPSPSLADDTACAVSCQGSHDMYPTAPHNLVVANHDANSSKRGGSLVGRGYLDLARTP